MRVLVVDDDDTIVRNITAWIEARDPECDIRAASNRDSAMQELETDGAEFDVVICDLKIPPSDSSIDDREEFGMEVHEASRRLHPGTPCVFFTGHADDFDTYDQIARGPVEDIYGDGEQVPLVRLIRKTEYQKAEQFLDTMSTHLHALEEIRIVDSDELPLAPFMARVVRIFAARFGGVLVEIQRLGGLSGALTCRIRVVNREGVPCATCFAKLGDRVQVIDEVDRFQQLVPVHVDPARIPTIAGTVLFGAGQTGGVFYSLADRFDRNLFDVMGSNQGDAVSCLAELRQAVRPWEQSVSLATVEIRELRRFAISDEDLASNEGYLDEFDRERLEAGSFEASFIPQHGDLHGENVLVDRDGHVMLIDYTDVDRLIAATDPIVLELSTVFHPGRSELQQEWPSVQQAQQWPDVDAFARGSPFEEFVRECRAWAMTSASGDLEVLATAYAQAVRQLKYADTRKDLAGAIAVAAGQAALRLLTS